eukprot:RCo004785
MAARGSELQLRKVFRQLKRMEKHFQLVAEVRDQLTDIASRVEALEFQLALLPQPCLGQGSLPEDAFGSSDVGQAVDFLDDDSLELPKGWPGLCSSLVPAHEEGAGD